MIAQQRRGLVQDLHDGQVRKVRPSGLRFLSGSAGAIRRLLAHTPAERKHVDVACLAGARPFHTVNKKIRIYRHVLLLSPSKPFVCSVEPARRYFAGAGRSATSRNDTLSSSSWKCGRRNATARYEPGFPGTSTTSTRASRS